MNKDISIGLNKNIAGFTLVELTIVIILIAIISAGIYVLWPSSVIKLNAQVALVANDIRYTQNLSMTRGERYRFARVSATSYRVTDSVGNSILLPSGQTTVTLESGVSFGSFVNLPNNLIVFNGKGVPYINTAIPGTKLALSAAIFLAMGTTVRSISISPETGRVTI